MKENETVGNDRSDVVSPRAAAVMEDRTVELGEGQMFVVKKGVRHNPVAKEECHLLLIERSSTQHTGDVITDKTRSIEEQLRPLGA